MVRLFMLIALIAVVVAVDYDSNLNQASPTERSERTKWRFPTEAEARATCARPVNMMTSATQDCYRVPTVPQPYCPF